MTTLDVALGYFRRGWSIIPMQAGTKMPTLRSWASYQTARPKEGSVRNWFRDGLDVGIAVVLGDVSRGLICRDFDQMESFERWAEQYPQLAAELPIVETSRGRHVYFVGDVEQIREASRNAKSIIEYDDGELRGGGLCMLPFSRHPSGKTYQWLRAPESDIPKLDLAETGFARSWGDVACVTESTERAESTETTERTQTPEVILACQSVSRLQNDSPLAVTQDSLQLHSQDAIEHAITSTLPTAPGQRNKLVFVLARALKAIPGICDAPAKELDSIVRRWHQLALPVITTEPFEETWIDFLKAWPKVKFPLGADPMTDILQRAISNPMPKAAERYEQQRLRLLVSLCRELQASAASEPFYLSCRTAGRLLEVDHMTANRWLFLLESDGLLTVTQKGSRETNKATRYRYCGG